MTTETYEVDPAGSDTNFYPVSSSSSSLPTASKTNVRDRVIDFKQRVGTRKLPQHGYGPQYVFKTNAGIDSPQLTEDAQLVLASIHPTRTFIAVGRICESVVAVSEDNGEAVSVFDPQDGEVHVSTFSVEPAGLQRFRNDCFGELERALEDGTAEKAFYQVDTYEIGEGGVVIAVLDS